ncbi:MAG: hypothetical protein H0T62_13220 [Parachlamydiaceae bacterium]|nr:hypothetical protein [Parachlamydiaceae bacterium]
MLGEFESYFATVDLDEFKAFLKEAKVENQRMKSQEGFSEGEEAEMVNFMMTLLENIEDEIQGVTSLSQLNFKKKVRLYSMIHLFHYICDDMEGEEEGYDYDGDEDEDEDEDEEPEHEGDKGPDNSKERIVRL